MPVVNGNLTPPTSDDTNKQVSSTKRKRPLSGSEDGEHDTFIQGTGKELDGVKEIDGRSREKEIFLQDILTIIQRHDTIPSILQHPLRDERDRSASGEASTKRAKLSNAEDSGTITTKINKGLYSSLKEFMCDIESVCADILAPIEADERNASQAPYPPYSGASTDGFRLRTQVLGFKKSLTSLVLREMQRKPSKLAEINSSKEDERPEQEHEVNGSEHKEIKMEPIEDCEEGRIVLTLYANAAGPRQLFSSFQKPRRLGSTNASSDVTVPLRESSLPNIISTTKVVPIHVEEAINGKKGVPKFGELFAPPASLPHLEAPKPSKHTATRASTITWGFDDVTTDARRKSELIYPVQPHSTGQWLDYSGFKSSRAHSTPEAKRKQRDRALSTGESNPPLSDADIAAMQQARIDALFRSAYSSFAPTRDDSDAIIPEEIKSRVWWHKVGERRFRQALALDPALEDNRETQITSDAIHNVVSNAAEKEDIGEREEISFKEAVEDFIPEPDYFEDRPRELEGQSEVDRLLEEVTDLLETLASYQRIRNASIISNSRTPMSQSSSLAALIGSPSTPSSAEKEVYDLLKSQLALIVSQLPPYAIAKLNGDQLAELNINKTMLIKTKNYRGVMEEDQVSRLAKDTALSATVATPISRMGSSLNSAHASFSTPGHHYGRSSAMAQPSVPRSAYQGNSFYYPQQQPPPSRSNPSSYRTPTANAQSAHTPTNYSSAGQRAAFSQHSHPAARQQHQSQYRHSNGQAFYQQRPAQQNYGYGQSHFSQSTPSQSGKYQPSNTPQDQARPMNTGAAYPYSSSSHQHPSASSQSKSLIQNNNQAFSQNQSLPGYSPQNLSQRQFVQQQRANQGNGQYGSQHATPSALGPSGFHTSMTTEQQQVIMDRQRAQLSMKPQAVVSPQSNNSRQDPNAPQPANGHTGDQVNGTPMAA